MSNDIQFYSFNPLKVGLTESEVRDIVDSIFRGNSKFTIFGEMTEERKNKPTLGLHTVNVFSGRHEIYLAPEKIRKVFSEGRATGGNAIVPDCRLAMACVLAHEVQHANQYLTHNLEHSSFFGKKRSKYKKRPCEREARQVADESIPVLAAILNLTIAKDEIKKIPEDEVYFIADCLSEADEVTTQDIVEELRQSGINNAVNVMKVKNFLAEWGITK